MQNTFGAQQQVLPTFYPGALYRWLLEKGYKSEELLSNIDIDPQQLQASEAHISFEQHKNFIQNCIQLTQNPHLGLSFGQHLNITHLGLLGYAAMSCANLRQAIQIFVDYFKLRSPLIKPELVVEGDSASINLIETLDYGQIRTFMCEAAICSLHNIIRSLVGGGDIIDCATVAYAKPAGWHPLPDVPCFLFGQASHGICFSAKHLSATLATVDPNTQQTVKQLCDQLLEKVQFQEGIITRLNMAILSQPEPFPSLEVAAAKLLISPRTLRRELQNLGTTYQKVLDKNRQRLALDYLQRSTLSIQQISTLLGYHNPPSFARAFKSWTGRTASSYR